MELIRSRLLFRLLLGSSVFSAPLPLQCPDVEARPGSNATLQCFIKTTIDLCKDVTLEVTYKGDTVMVFREEKDDVNSRHEKFKGAVLLEGLCSGTVSVKLINVTTNCSGIYTVSVKIEGETISSPINLTVREQPDVTPTNIKQLNQQGDNGTLGSDKQGRHHIGIGIGITFIIVAFVIWHARKKAPDRRGEGEEED